MDPIAELTECFLLLLLQLLLLLCANGVEVGGSWQQCSRDLVVVVVAVQLFRGGDWKQLLLVSQLFLRLCRRCQQFECQRNYGFFLGGARLARFCKILFVSAFNTVEVCGVRRKKEAQTYFGARQCISNHSVTTHMRLSYRILHC